MSRGRFGVLLALLVLVVGVASFLGGVALFDEGTTTPDGVDDPGGSDDAGTTTTASTASTVPAGLQTPTFVVIVTSEGSEASAQATRSLTTPTSTQLRAPEEGHHDEHPDPPATPHPAGWVAGCPCGHPTSATRPRPD